MKAKEFTLLRDKIRACKSVLELKTALYLININKTLSYKQFKALQYEIYERTESLKYEASLILK